jgi:hypothetical protein
MRGRGGWERDARRRRGSPANFIEGGGREGIFLLQLRKIWVSFMWSFTVQFVLTSIEF